MKILHIGSKTFPPKHGGVEKIVFDISQGMSDVESFHLVEWEQEDVNDKVQILKKGLFFQFEQVKKTVSDNQIDIIHLHKETFVPLAILLRISGRKVVWTNHGCAWRISRWAWHYRAIFWLLDFFACYILSKAIFVGERDWRYFQKLVLFRRICFVKNGVECDLDKMSENSESMVFLGRLSPEKNIVSLIDAADKYQCKLDLYGPFDKHDPQYEEQVLEKLKNSQFVKWNGAVAYDQVPSILAKYRSFVNPSFSEGMPVSVLEAAAMGLHLILSDIPQHRYLGLPSCAYIDPYNIDFSDINQDLEGDSQNQAYVKKEYSKENMVKSYLTIYKEII